MKENLDLKLRRFFSAFNKSNKYYLGMALIVFLGIVFYPWNSYVYNFFKTGPFIVGTLAALLIMLATFFFYKNVFLYLYVIAGTLWILFLFIVGTGMGSRNLEEALLKWLPVLLVLIFNIFISFVTFKYKKS